MKPAICIVLALALAACRAAPAELTIAEATRARESVLRVLEAQQQAWNVGLIDDYMEGYQRSPELMFVSGDRVRYGWQATRDGYHAGYDSPEKMGRLAFTDIDVRILCKDAALVTGAWRLERADDRPRGRFTLLFRKSGDAWRIVLDHTSAAAVERGGDD